MIATIGIHASASTWVFNIVRELMIAASGAAQVLAVYGDKRAEMPDDTTLAGRLLIVKSHHGSDDLDAWLAAQQARLVLSVRDPRDASISMAQRFRAPLNHTARWLAQDCNRITRLARPGQSVLRYEDRFFDDIVWTQRIAAALDLSLAAPVMADIFDRYRTESVRAFAKNLADLPAERLTVGTHSTSDRVTQIHNVHIGDTRSGKWRDLPEPLRGEMTRYFRPFLVRFNYPEE